MPRVPSLNPKRDAEIARLKKKLAYFQSIPAHRRADECADETERDLRAMIEELEKR